MRLEFKSKRYQRWSEISHLHAACCTPKRLQRKMWVARVGG